MNQDNLILCKEFRFVETPPPVGGRMAWCVGGLMGGVM